MASFAIVILAAFSYAPAASADITVGATGDGTGGCTLRDAIESANAHASTGGCGPVGSGTTQIILPAGHYTLAGSQLQTGATANIAITGADANAPTQTIIDANHLSRVFEVLAGGQILLSDLEITGGQTADGIDGLSVLQSGTAGGHGGGILNHGSLTLDHAVVTDNFTGHGGSGADGTTVGSMNYRGASGGPSGSGGGIYNDTGALLAVNDSTVNADETGDGGVGGNGAGGVAGYSNNPIGGAGGSGGSAGSGGGLFNLGSTIITDSTISDNRTGRGGPGGLGGRGAGEVAGGPGVEGGAGAGGMGGRGGGGGVYRTVGTGDPSFPNGATSGGGGIANRGILTITASTISENGTGAGGKGGGAGLGGVSLNGNYYYLSKGGEAGSGGMGGGLFVAQYGATQNLTNVTVAGNFVGDGGTGGNGPQSGSAGGGNGGFGGYGGGIFAIGTDGIGGYLQFIHATVAKNMAGGIGQGGIDGHFPGAAGGRGKGAGLYVDAGQSSNGSNVYFRNTVLAGNGFGVYGDVNCAQYYDPSQQNYFVDQGHNVSYGGPGNMDMSCPGITGNPLLGPLQDNGGPTRTMLPSIGSTLIAAVTPCDIPTDQRGNARPGGGNAGCDIGAVESGLAPGAVTTSTTLSSSANPSTAGQKVTYTATVSPTPSGGAVQFTDGSNTISGCAASPIATNKAVCQVGYATAGSHSIVANYLGYPNFFASSSPALSQTVKVQGGGGSGGDGGGGGGAGGGSGGATMFGKASVGKTRIRGTRAVVPLTCVSSTQANCVLRFGLSTVVNGKARSSSASNSRSRRKKKKLLTVGTRHFSLPAGVSKKVSVALNHKGRKLLKKAHRLRVTLTAMEQQDGTFRKVLSKRLTFKAKKKNH